MDAKSKRALIVTLLILAGAFSSRLAAAYWWQSRLPAGARFGFGDSDSYWILAESIARGKPFKYGPGDGAIFRTPGYPLLLAPLFLISNEPPALWARVEGALFGTLAVAGVMWLAHRLFTFQVAIWAGVAAALYPGAIATSIFVLSEAPYCPLLIGQLAGWTYAWQSRRWQSLTAGACLAGLAGGAATLVRPSHLLFTPFALTLAMIAPQRGRNLVIGALMLASLTVTMAPWWWRNYQVTDRFVATTLQMGASLYDGLSPQATGASDMSFVPKFLEAQQAADAASDQPLVGTLEQRLDQRMKDAALEWAKNNPTAVLGLAVKKFLRMWSPLPNAAEFQSPLLRLVVFAGYTPLLVLALIGIWKHASSSWPYALCTMPAIYLTLLHMVFVSSIRYREPAMLPLIILAAAALLPATNRSAVSQPHRL